MEQPDKDKKKYTVREVQKNANGEIELTPEEVRRNKIVKEKSTTEPQKESFKKTEGLDLDTKSGTTSPRPYEKKLQLAKQGSGKQSRLVDGGGKVLREAQPGSVEEKKLKAYYKQQKVHTESSRKEKSDVHNVQVGKGDKTEAYERKVQDAVNRGKMQEKDALDQAKKTTFYNKKKK